MPNWTFNEIRCDDNSDVIRAITNETGKIDFNMIIPMNEDLNIESGSITDEAVMYFLSDRFSVDENECKDMCKEYNVTPYCDYKRIRENLNNDKMRYNDETLYNLGKRYIENKEKYGYLTWYEWCRDNWSVKWNACDSYVSDDFTVCSFSTAWNMPFAIFEKICEMFPNEEIDFSGEYEDGLIYYGFNDNGTFHYTIEEKPYDEEEDELDW